MHFRSRIKQFRLDAYAHQMVDIYLVHDGLLIKKPLEMRFPSRKNTHIYLLTLLAISTMAAALMPPQCQIQMEVLGDIPPKPVQACTSHSFKVVAMLYIHLLKWHPKGPTDQGLAGISAPDVGMDRSTSNFNEAGLREEEGDVEKLRSEIATLTRNYGVSDMDLQTLRRQIVMEGQRG